MSNAQISTSRASFGDQTYEDGLSTTSQHRSESSSCSNSLSTQFPNRKVPEASKKACSPYNSEEKNIDLNEDILNVDGSDDLIQPMIGHESSQGVVKVVVKIGVPSGWPQFPLEFAGELGWKGPSKTSAFRSVSISKNSDRKMCFFTGIDLNIAAVEDSDVDLKRGEESPNFDLNRLYDDDDDITPQNSHLLDLNLNVNNTNSSMDSARSGNRDFNPIISSDYLPKFPFLPPLQSYPSKGRFHVGLFNPGAAKSNHLDHAFHEQLMSRKCLFLANNSSMRERLQQESWLRTSNKRKETEGGSEFYQLR